VIRDADRTRSKVLDAAEELFARRGYDATSLADIGTAAGVSRGTPSYCFGSKEQLYDAVLERLYADRTAALEPAFAPLRAWAAADAPQEPLETVLAGSVGGYVEFLRARPSFVDLFEREALAGGERLRRIEPGSTVMEDAFAALHAARARHALRDFDPGEVVMCLVALAYMPVAHRGTLLRRQGIGVDDPGFAAARTRHIVDVLLHVLGGARAVPLRRTGTRGAT
jgi:TetR/AcrR family transcriptional regulator